MMFRCNTTSCIGDAESDTVCSLVIFYLATIQKDTSLCGILYSVGKHFIDGLQSAVTVSLYSVGVCQRGMEGECHTVCNFVLLFCYCLSA